MLGPAPNGTFWRVYGYNLVTGAAATIQWKSGTAVGAATNTVISGRQPHAANGGIVVYPPNDGWVCDAKPGEALFLNVSNAAVTGGSFLYARIDTP